MGIVSPQAGILLRSAGSLGHSRIQGGLLFEAWSPTLDPRAPERPCEPEENWGHIAEKAGDILRPLGLSGDQHLLQPLCVPCPAGQDSSRGASRTHLSEACKSPLNGS